MKLLRNIVAGIVAAFFASTILAVVFYKVFPVWVTPLMVIQSVKTTSFWHHTWVPLRDISHDMPVAVMASEDQRFLSHHGFDFDAIQSAVKKNKRAGRNKYGASTISQQTAKNVFLWPGRSWVRKGLEVYFTTLIEFIWGKERIMEVYLNSIEMGRNIYGVEACAHYNFRGKTAKELSRRDCALIAATLPNPREFSSKEPSSYMYKRQAFILRQMKYVKWTE
jgi:monofunctional biosynthetic peptidoglycan transglycosylase